VATVAVESLTAAAAAGAGTVLTNAASNSNHRMVATMASYAGSGVVVVALETSLDDVTWVGAGTVAFEGDATLEIAAGPLPAQYVRANLLAYPPTVTAGAVTAYVTSSG